MESILLALVDILEEIQKEIDILYECDSNLWNGSSICITKRLDDIKEFLESRQAEGRNQ